MIPEIKQRIEQIRRGEVPKGYRKGKLGVVPKEWKDIPFSTLFTSTSDYTDDLSRYPLYSLTIEDGVTPKTERYERSHLVKKEESYKIVRPNDFAYNPMNLRFGAVARHKGDIPVAVSGYYDIFTTVHESDLPFMDSFLTSNAMITYYNRVSTGSLIEKQRVHFSQFLDFVLPLPPIEERAQIAAILTTQDKIIELQTLKIDELKKIKKAYLSKMFPGKGHKKPELRFKGFTDAWKQHKFSELYEKVNRKNDLTYGRNDIISVANMYFKPDSHMTDDSYLLTYNVFELGDIAFEGNKSKSFAHGRFVENTIGNGIVSHVFDVFHPIMKQYDLQFWKYAINNERIMGGILARCTKASTMMTNLVASDFLNESITVPSYEEQKEIGAFFIRLDNFIALHQRKLNEMKKFKKALMQLLLTGIVRVKG